MFTEILYQRPFYGHGSGICPGTGGRLLYSQPQTVAVTVSVTVTLSEPELPPVG